MPACRRSVTTSPACSPQKLSFLRRRSKIVEIVSAGDIVFALTLSGVCGAFRGTERLAFLNTTPDEGALRTRRCRKGGLVQTRIAT